jgi:lipoate-protein ligase A
VIIDKLTESFQRRFGLVPDSETAEELAEAERLIETRFGTREWIYFLP